MDPASECFLFDNGSLRAASTLSLRRIADALSRRLGLSVRAVSLLHSSGVDPAELEGVSAELLEPVLGRALAAGLRRAVLLPLFFGPSGALMEYVPDRLRALLRSHAGADVRLARCLVDPSESGDTRVAEALADRVRACAAARRIARPNIVLVDHGSPQRAVGAVRDHLTLQLKKVMGEGAAEVAAAAMERREGEAYAFNEPLLASRLRTPPFDAGDVIVALQFISPGRHAGPGGDIATLCKEAETCRPGLRTHLTEPLGDHSRVIDVLADRYDEAARTN